MKAILAEVGPKPETARIKNGAVPEDWPTVCRRFGDDVERVCDIEGQEDYTGLYQCFDEKNQGVYYLVCEDRSLYRLKRKTFLGNIGAGE